jgi:Tfp pilus assembly protein PilN
MADMDMIPRSYRDALRVRRTLLAYGGALALALATGLLGAGWLHWRLSVEEASLHKLRAANASADAVRTQVAAAEQRKSTLLQASDALAALRGAGTVSRLASALDTALNDGTTLNQLQFSRTQELLKAPLPQPLPAGTVQAQNAGNPEYWHLASRVDITGQARDHAALTRFLGAIGRDPTLSGLRFLNSATAAGEGQGGLAFSVSGLVDVQGGQR